jgi:EmrB/QacA subfamily drug resistance transporter
MTSKPLQQTDPSSQRPYLVLLLLCGGATFLSLLDATITNLAVTNLHSSFPYASDTDFTWIITLYAITFACVLAPAGRLADAIGRRSLYLVGVAVFTSMSLVCALAPTLPILLAARALQGSGAAAMVPASLAILLAETAAARRAAAVGMWSAAASAAAAVGPSLGGVLIQYCGWRSVFVINVPIGIAMLVVGRRLGGHQLASAPVPDPVGTVQLGGGVGLLTLGVIQGPDWHWNSGRVLAALGIGSVLVGLAVNRSRRQSVPAIDVGLWRSRNFAVTNAVSLFFGAALYAWLLIGALITVALWHYSWLVAGLAMSPGAIVSAAVGIGAGRLMNRGNPRWIVLAGGVAVLIAGVWLALGLRATPDFVSFWLPLGLLAGAGWSAMSTGLSSAAALSVPPTQFAAAIGLNTAVRQVGGALGIAALAAIMPAHLPTVTHSYRSVVWFCCGATAVAIALSGMLGPRQPEPTTPRAVSATEQGR